MLNPPLESVASSGKYGRKIHYPKRITWNSAGKFSCKRLDEIKILASVHITDHKVSDTTFDLIVSVLLFDWCFWLISVSASSPLDSASHGGGARGQLVHEIKMMRTRFMDLTLTRKSFGPIIKNGKKIWKWIK